MQKITGTQWQQRRWLVTGATGFIGREFIRSLLQQASHKDRISLLVRPGATVTAQQRFKSAFENILTPNQLQRIIVVCGDIERPQFGLSDEHWNSLSSTTHLIHLAANTSMISTLEQARRCNVGGVENVIELAFCCQDAGHLQHWSHVSSAYVAGQRTDTVIPGELSNGGGFRNSYEQSKNEAEVLLQPLLARFPLTVFRPAIVAGHNATGKAGNLNCVHRSMHRHLSSQTRVYAAADVSIDIIPVDYVIAAMFQLMADPRATGKTLHLAAGPRGAMTLFDFIHSICRYLGSPAPEIVNPAKLRLLKGANQMESLTARDKILIQHAESHLPYFTQNPTFDTSETEKLLAATGIEVPQFNTCIDKILDDDPAPDWDKHYRIVGGGYQQQAIVNG